MREISPPRAWGADPDRGKAVRVFSVLLVPGQARSVFLSCGWSREVWLETIS